MRFLRYATAVRITVGPFLDKTDGITPETGLTPTNCHVVITKDDDDNTAVNSVLDSTLTASGGNNDMVHIAHGMYDLELTEAQTTYLGRVMLGIFDEANHCPVFHEFMILPQKVYDSLTLGTDNLEVDTIQWLGTACATPTVDGVPEVDITHANGTAQTATPDSLASQISGIGSGTGAALNFAPAEDNASGAIIGGTTKVGTQTNTYTSTTADNAVYHDIAHSGNAIDWVYGFSVGAGRNCAKVTWNGQYVVAAPIAGKSINVYAWNFTGTPAWDLVKVVAGQASGGSDVTVDIALLAAHTGTGADAGKVYIRFAAATNAVTLKTDMLLAQGANLGQTVGYANGSIWVRTAANGTTPYVHGTADNPCSWANAKDLSTALGMKRFVITPGTTVTLDAGLTGAVMSGRSFLLALGSQDISGSYFEGVEGLGGTGTCPTGEAIIVDSHLNAVTIGEADFVRCHLMNTVTMSQNTVPYRFHDCTGVTAAKIVFTGDAQSAVVSKASGAITIAGMQAGNTLYIDGNLVLTLDDTNTGGTIYVSGAVRLTDDSSGTTVYRDGVATDTADEIDRRHGSGPY